MSPWFLACGWVGQGACACRTLDQWLRSERARRTVLPRAFWTWSIVGAVLTLIYNLGRADAVFVLGALVTGGIFVRNAFLGTEAPGEHPERPALWPLLGGVVLFAVLVALDLGRVLSTFEAGVPLAWSVVGFAGQTAWSGRFVAQWLESEHRGHSVLPASFFALGFLGSLLLAGYALVQGDWVNVAGYAPNPVPYGRNLWILLRSRAAAESPAPSTEAAG